MLKLHWIPDQVRNDKTAISAIWAIATQPLTWLSLSQAVKGGETVRRTASKP